MSSFTLFTKAALMVAVAGSVAVAQPQVVDLGLLPGDAQIRPASNSQTDTSVAKGGAGYLLVWTDYRGGAGGSQSAQSQGDIFGVRLDAQGLPIDAAPFLIAGGAGVQQYPIVAWNGDAWLVVYKSQDPVNGYFEMRTRARRVTAAGQVLDPTPLLLGNAQLGFSIAGSGGEWLVTSEIYHADGYGTYLAGQRISGQGQLLNQTPVMLIDWVYGQARALAVDGGYVVAGPDWTDNTIVRARRFTSSLAPVGTAFTLPGMNVASSGSGLYATWIRDFVNVVGSPISLTGVRAVPNGTVLFSDPGVQYYQSYAAHDGTNWWYAWGAGGNYWTKRINGAGQVLDPVGVQVPIVIDGTVNAAYNVSLTPRTGGGVFLFWDDSRAAMGNDTNVYSFGMSASNTPESERCQSVASTLQRSPNLCQGPAGTVASAFVSEAANDDRVLVHLLSRSGEPLSVEPIEVHRAPTIGNVGIAWDGAEYLVVWDEGAAGLSTVAVRARRMAADGSFLDAVPLQIMAGFNPSVDALDGRFLIAATRYGSNFQLINLYGMRVDGASGAVLDQTGGMLLANGYYTGGTRVRTDGSGWLVCSHAMWSANSSQGDVTLSQVPYDGPANAAFNPTPTAGGTGDLDIAFSGNEYLLVWRLNTLASGNNSISGRFMNADGTYRGGAFTVAEAAGRQLRPTVAFDGSNFVIVWEDQRNQSSFFDARTDVYGVRIAPSGQFLDAAAFPVSAVADGDTASSIVARDGYALVATPRFVTTGGFDSYRLGITGIGVPRCPTDMNGDGGVDGDDVIAFFAAWDVSDPSADFTGDGGVDGDDVIGFFARWDGGC
ncbi:MAG: GC-type dockerin domain-anchored protein [Phycisphaerales bacterium]